jgi:type 1 glutamine amidotransferase
MTTLRGLCLTVAFVIAATVWPIAQNPPAPAPRQAPEGQAGAQRGGGRQPRQRTRKVVLAWADTRNGQSQHESVSHALAVIERLGYDSGLYDTFIRTDSHIAAMDPKKTTGEPASGGPNLRMADAIFFLGHRDVPIDEQQKNDLLKFVREDGKGLVAAHIALTAFDSWPAFGELLGGRYDGHPWGSASGTVINEGTDFPITRHFPATFPFHDEFYQPKEFSREKARVLLRLDVSKMPPNENYHGKGDMPLAWAKNYGKGRVFYSSFGHDASTWDNRDVAQMYLEALKWALGMSEGDLTPRPLTTVK